MTTFAKELERAIVAQKMERRGAKILEVIRARPSRRRNKILARLESHARAELGIDQSALIDWSKIDWKEILKIVLPILLKLLVLFLDS